MKTIGEKLERFFEKTELAVFSCAGSVVPALSLAR